jgi:hypothetical protein
MDSIERAHYDLKMLLPSSDSRYFSPEELDAAINLAVTDLFNMQYKAFGETQRISDDLSQFKVIAPIPLAAGIGPLPANHLYTLSVYVTKIGTVSIIKRLRIVEEQFIAQYIDSEAFAPTEDFCICRLIGTNIHVYPETVTEIGITYFRRPSTCKFAYTLTGLLGNIPVYDAINSIQIDYSEAAYNQILQKALTYLGVAQKDSTLMQEQQMFRQNSTPEVR